VKRFLTLAMLALVAIPLVAGCGGGVKTYTDSGQVISVGAGQEFIISLASNPTTGYGWQENHDETMVELVERTYQQGEGAEQGMVGAGGVELFRFRALSPGDTRITLVYKRPWEEEIADQKIFTVDIK